MNYPIEKQWTGEDAPNMQLGQSARQTRRQNLEYRRRMIQLQLDDVNAALAALDAHPDLEEFIETLAKAGA